MTDDNAVEPDETGERVRLRTQTIRDLTADDRRRRELGRCSDAGHAAISSC